MIRVLHYIGSLHYEGAQSFVMELYRNIDRSNIQFDFVVFPEERVGFYDEIKKYGGEIYECPRYRLYNHFLLVKWWNDFLSIHHSAYSLIHVHQTVTARPVIRIAKKYSLPTILHSHSNSNGTGPLAKLKDALQYGLVRLPDYMYGCSDEAGQYLFGKDVLNNGKYETLKNAINISRFAYDPHRRNAFRNELHIDDRYVIGAVGRFYNVKNQIFLINMMPQILQRIPKAFLLLVGSGPNREMLERRAAELKIETSVLFVGSRDNTEDYYQAMDLFVMPSLYEGFGIVALEAQACGLPCLLSDAIPRLVNVTGSVEFVALAEELWINKIEQAFSCFERKCCENIADIYQAGFDSKALAKKIEMKYYELSKAKK